MPARPSDRGGLRTRSMFHGDGVGVEGQATRAFAFVEAPGGQVYMFGFERGSTVRFTATPAFEGEGDSIDWGFLSTPARELVTHSLDMRGPGRTVMLENTAAMFALLERLVAQ